MLSNLERMGSVQDEHRHLKHTMDYEDTIIHLILLMKIHAILSYIASLN